MANYVATVHSPRSAEDVFAYLADFRSVAEWDPSITASEHVNGDDPVRVGARFRVTTSTTLKDVVLDYETVALEAPRNIVLRGENDTMVSIDTITIAARADGGSEVTYAADITLKGVRKLADPALNLGLRRLGDKAKQGLAAKLSESA